MVDCSCKSLQTSFNNSHGSTSIAKAIKYSSSTRNFVLALFVSSLKRVLLIPVLRETSERFTDFRERNNPNSVIIVCFSEHKSTKTEQFFRKSEKSFGILSEIRYVCLENRINHFKNKNMSLQRTYTKSQLEELIYSQLENLNAMNDLISIMRHQNDLLKNANKKLKEEITDFKERHVNYPTRRNRSSK